jgi:hypothetical protein
LTARKRRRQPAKTAVFASPMAFLFLPRYRKLFSTITRTISDDTISGHGRTRQKRPRFYSRVLLCSRRSPTQNLSYVMSTFICMSAHSRFPSSLWYAGDKKISGTRESDRERAIKIFLWNS